MLGPVQMIAIGFESLDNFRGEILDRLEEVTPLSAVRILDVLFVAKEDNGDVVALETSDLGLEEGDEFLGTIIGELLGFSFEDEEPTGSPVEIGEASAIGVTPGDVQRIAADLAPGTGAAMFLIEHQWAAGLRDAIADAGGSLIVQGFLTLEGLVMVGAELQATADAIAAVELAEAVEAEAIARSIEALATIEIAAEVEAAVVARTVLGLVESGFLEAADVEDAVGALLDAELIERATATERSS